MVNYSAFHWSEKARKSADTAEAAAKRAEAAAGVDLDDYATKVYVDTTEQEIIQNFMDADTALQTQITGLSGVLDGEQDKITAIEGKIPANASTSNMLSTASDLLSATQDVRSDFAEADSELQTQINGQATAISNLSDDVMANMGEIADIKEQIKNVGGGRNIGDIFYTTRTDAELNGSVECNGATFNTSDFIGSESIGVLLSDGKVPYVSLTEYQTAIDTNGSCRAFGWDGGDSFRVPTLQDVYIEAGTALTAGEFIGESLPNITGRIGGLNTATTDGAFYNDGTANGATGNVISLNVKRFDASRSSSTYQDGAKVKPDSVRYRAMVQLANEATDEALITATSVLQQIANLEFNKVDKTTPHIVETYKNGTSWYRVYSDGWCEQGGTTNYSTNPLTINLLKEMKDTNYTALAIEQNSGGGCWTQITGKSTTTVSAGRFYANGSSGSAGAGKDVNWEVKGYIS